MMDERSQRAGSLLAQVDTGLLSHVQDLFRTASRKVRSRLVNRSGTDIPVRFGTADLANLGQVQDRQMSQEGAFARFRMQPGDLPGMIVIQGPLLFRLVGIMLGEDPGGDPPLYRWRSLTNVDLRIAQRICEDALNGLLEACPVQVQPSIDLEVVSANPRMPFPLPRSTMVVEATLDFGPPEDPYGLMSIILPAQLAGVLWPKGRARKERTEDAVSEGMKRVLPLGVTLVAELGRLRMPLGQMNQLQIGSVIDLGPFKQVTVMVGDRDTMVAEPGERDGVRCVRVVKRITESAEQY